MIQLSKASEEDGDSSSLPSMDHKASTQVQASSLVFPVTMRDSLESGKSFYCTNKQNPLADHLSAKTCSTTTENMGDNRGLFEASVKRRREGLSAVTRRRLETPTTPGRPVFSFSPGHLPRKGVPSKWDDAEKWLISSHCHESPAHVKVAVEASKFSRQNGVIQENGDAFVGKLLRVAQDKAPSSPNPASNGPAMNPETNVAFSGASSDVLLKDKFTENVESVYPNYGYSEITKEGFLFKSSYFEPMKDSTTALVAEIERRDVGTEMTPLGSSTATRCHTPVKITSPARHNTPADRSGPLVPHSTGIDISELTDCHFAKLELSAQYDSFVSNWSSREEEDEEVSKSLRHLEISGGRKSSAKSRASAWEEEQRTKSCVRYQREEAKIQAWVNLQSAKAEAQSRKLEVKIQKMRSDLEEKLMKRMAIVHRRAEEWRAAAQLQHSQQLQRLSLQAQKMKSQQQSTRLSGETACGCFPCNHHL
ncbi:uncharacterized protein LOC135650449 [Musa acuminata AAA Group]|uniref:uncharacterized protein LOC103969920 n=1 Tax=Musa acuminata AAA Group TaxID=214697 RepID=UPI0031DA0ABC